MNIFSKNLKPLTNYDIENLVKKLKIKNFRGVFMRDTLPNNINDIECGIVNLDLSTNKGTHWICYFKNVDYSYYFDPFGLDPPIEVQKYLNSEIFLSTYQIQNFNTNHCGHYCLLMLKLLENFNFMDIILAIL